MNKYVFTKYPKTKRLIGAELLITQKMDGSNTTIIFEDREVSVFSRNRQLTEEQDNFQCYEFVKEHEEALYDVLGEGIHRMEFCGPKIQTTEGLTERMFFSFNPFLEVPMMYHHIIRPVPLLYQGDFSITVISGALTALKECGSFVNGFNKPEGIIARMGGDKYKVYLNQIHDLGTLE